MINDVQIFILMPQYRIEDDDEEWKEEKNNAHKKNQLF